MDEKIIAPWIETGEKSASFELNPALITSYSSDLLPFFIAQSHDST